MDTQSYKQLSKNVPNGLANNFISKNKCLCETIEYQYVYKNPREYEDIYVELYKQILYNLTLIKNLTFITDSLGNIRIRDKLIMLKIISSIKLSIESFCKTEINYSIYGEDNIFYACLPFYKSFNELSYIKISKGINFKRLMEIKTESPDFDIRDIVNNLIGAVTFYLLY